MTEENIEETPDAADAAASEVPAVEPPPAEGGSPAGSSEAAAPAAPAEVLDPKERRQRARAARAVEVRPQRTPEERQAERERVRAEKAARRRVTRKAGREKARAAAGDEVAATEARHVREPGSPKVRQGYVVSNKADKTITVRIDVSRRHRRYEKIVRATSTLHAHDERNEAHEGDLVRIVETRPLSRTKRWRLTDVLERAR
jgi:small subunit ribosomal protein S17